VNARCRIAIALVALAPGLTYAQAHDGDGSEKDRFGVTGFPETFVLDPTGRAVQWFPGPIDADGLRAAIEKARAS